MQKFYGLLAALGIAASVGHTAVDAGGPGIRNNIPPAARLAEPGPMVGGPGPGVLAPEIIPVEGMGMQGAMQATVQILFNQPESMQVLYDIIGDNTFTSDPLVVPGRLEFAQGGIYRMKLTNIQGREGVELYPTLEVGAATPRTAAYLAHNAIPIQFSDEDFDQALSGNFVTKVLYLPDPEFQGDALAGVTTLVSTRLEPGLDPIVEADRRGSIMAILRLGNKDIEMSGPSMGGMGYPGGMMMGGDAMCGPAGGGGMPPNFVAGATAPQYGMTYTGTPIGLAGPPHIPFGAPAGLQKHVIKNHTHTHIPDPTSNVKMHVRQIPGNRYPEPASRVRIREQNIHPGYPSGVPHQASRLVPGGTYGDANGAYCPPGRMR